MGNRAVITTDGKLNDIGVYLHWNGGRDSVEAFLAYCKMKGERTPESDEYGFGALIAVIHNCGLNVAVNVAKKLDWSNWDNGTYIIKNWLIVGRKGERGKEQFEYDFKEMLEWIDSCQPEELRLTKEQCALFDDVKQQVMVARENEVSENEESEQ